MNPATLASVRSTRLTVFSKPHRARAGLHRILLPPGGEGSEGRMRGKPSPDTPLSFPSPTKLQICPKHPVLAPSPRPSPTVTRVLPTACRFVGEGGRAAVPRTAFRNLAETRPDTVASPLLRPLRVGLPTQTDGVELRGTRQHSRIVCAWHVSTSQLTLAVRRYFCAAGIKGVRTLFAVFPGVGWSTAGSIAARCAGPTSRPQTASPG